MWAHFNQMHSCSEFASLSRSFPWRTAFLWKKGISGVVTASGLESGLMLSVGVRERASSRSTASTMYVVSCLGEVPSKGGPPCSTTSSEYCGSQRVLS